MIKYILSGGSDFINHVQQVANYARIPQAVDAVSGFFGQSSSGMRPPGYQKNIVGSVKGGVDVNVRFDNAPATMRVAPSKTRGPVRSNLDVGYGFTHAMYLGMP
jgi:hypothetical protein